ncbi:hypothetical protein ABID22_003474 [Pontibacter aydingkolensis]
MNRWLDNWNSPPEPSSGLFLFKLDTLESKKSGIYRQKRKSTIRQQRKYKDYLNQKKLSAAYYLTLIHEAVMKNINHTEI